MAESAHKLTFPHELGRGSANLSRGDLRAVQEYVVDSFGGADGSRYDHLLYGTIGSCTDFDASGSDVGEHERPQIGVLSEKACRGHSTSEPGLRNFVDSLVFGRLYRKELSALCVGMKPSVGRAGSNFITQQLECAECKLKTSEGYSSWICLCVCVC